MKLDEAQRLKVEENHNLIYGYMKRKGLKEEEWYGLLAITLCEAVLTHDDVKGKISTYFYKLAYNAVSNEIKRRSYQKRSKYDEVSIDEMHEITPDTAIEIEEHEIGACDAITTTVVMMLLQGYKQYEIGEVLGVSQPYVSQLLKKYREDRFDV